MRLRFGLVTAIGLLLPALAAGGGPIDWAPYADVRTVTVVTQNEDGSPRETTIWLAVVEGQGYIRTGGSRWGGDIERDPNVSLRVGETELSLRVEFVEDEATRKRVVAAMREKYGFSDWLIGPFRGSRPKVMRLLPRDGA